jgi:hypothetical protein
VSDRDHQVAGPPPVGGTWPRLYAIVLLLLAVEIFIFWMFTRAFA